jgi:hypothetical protein
MFSKDRKSLEMEGLSISSSVVIYNQTCLFPWLLHYPGHTNMREPPVYQVNPRRSSHSVIPYTALYRVHDSTY